MLKLLKFIENRKTGKKQQSYEYWLCLCDCGKEKIIRKSAVTQGQITSCGCKKANKDYNKNSRIGNKYGEIEVIEFSHVENINKTKRSFWKCKCSCGNIDIFQLTSLIHKKTCGRPIHRIGNLNPNWKGFKDIPQNYWKNVLSNAKNKNRELSISIEDAWNKFLEQDSKCALSGVSIYFGNTNKETTASLDRIDSKKGYIKNNIQWIHKDVNKLKTNFDEKKFIEWCMLISKYKRQEYQSI